MRVKSKKSINFGDFAEYECENSVLISECDDCPVIRKEQFVIDSGYTFRLKCLPNGKFQSKTWQKCRIPIPCKLTPPYPPPSSGLVPYNPYEYRSNGTMMIREFSKVRYECKDEKMVRMYALCCTNSPQKKFHGGQSAFFWLSRGDNIFAKGSPE